MKSAASRKELPRRCTTKLLEDLDEGHQEERVRATCTAGLSYTCGGAASIVVEEEADVMITGASSNDQPIHCNEDVTTLPKRPSPQKKISSAALPTQESIVSIASQNQYQEPMTKPSKRRAKKRSVSRYKTTTICGARKITRKPMSKYLLNNCGPIR